MKQLGNGKGRRVHPAPSPGAAPQDHLAMLPAAVLALAAVLTAEEQEVLAYLLSGGGSGGRLRERRRRAHPPELGCGCFGCYRCFWARWDSSPNRHVIHNIIDAVEESLVTKELDLVGSGRRRRRGGRGGRKGAGLTAEVETNTAARPQEELFGVEGKALLGSEDGGHLADADGYNCDRDDNSDSDDDDDRDEMNGSNDINTKSSMRKILSFIGERVWGVWN